VTPHAIPRSSWPHVLVAFFAGCSTSFHFGKVPAAIPLLTAEFDSSLVWAGAVVSSLSLVLATCGLVIGTLAGRFPPFRVAVVALLTCGLASLFGALTHSLPLLLATRLIEGIGFTLAIVTLPALISLSVTERDRTLALGMWGGFMPTGFALMLMLSPPLVALAGWRGAWLFSGILTLGLALLTWLAFRRRALPGGHGGPLRAGLGIALQRRPLLMAGCFALFAGQFLSVVSFFPTLLLETFQIRAALAALLTGGVVLGNAFGNPIGGWLLRTGLSARAVVMTGMAAMGVTALLVFNPGMAIGVRIGACAVFSLFGGMIAGSLFANGPRLVARPEQMSGLMGLAMQGVGIGQFCGPILLGYTVDRFGWAYAPLFTVSAAALGFLFAAGLGSATRR
jgi:MFS family permease